MDIFLIYWFHIEDTKNLFGLTVVNYIIILRKAIIVLQMSFFIISGIFPLFTLILENLTLTGYGILFFLIIDVLRLETWVLGFFNCITNEL